MVRSEYADEEEEEEGKQMWTQEKEGKYLESHYKDEDDEEDANKDGEDDEINLSVRVIDSHWLQRELGKLFRDPEFIVSTEKEILSALVIPELQECENRLVYILKYDNFNLAKLILHNR